MSDPKKSFGDLLSSWFTGFTCWENALMFTIIITSILLCCCRYCCANLISVCETMYLHNLWPHPDGQFLLITVPATIAPTIMNHWTDMNIERQLVFLHGNLSSSMASDRQQGPEIPDLWLCPMSAGIS
jgi:hypothetical protein